MSQPLVVSANLVFLVSLSGGFSGVSTAAAEPALAGKLHVDAEVDPTAYVLSGNSLHVGLGYGRYRLDLGNFALALPQWLHGQDGFEVSFDGYGAKLQVFAQGEQRGWFAGIDGGWSRVLIRRQGTELAVRQDQLGLGANLGYRIAVVDRFYVTPWVGVGYQFGTRDVMLSGATYETRAVTVFPAIHAGYQFQ